MNLSGWPFLVVVDGDLEAGGPGSVLVDLRAPATAELYGSVRYGIETFAALAGMGGLGGDRVDPNRSHAALSPTLPIPAVSMRWDFATLAIDARSTSVLFSMLAFLAKDAIRSVTMRATGTGPRTPFTPEDLPPAWHHIPFGLDDDRTGRNVEFEVTFAQPVAPADQETVLRALGLWLDAGSVQGYRDFTVRDDRSFLLPTEDPTFELVGDSLVGRIEDSGVEEGAYDILLNVLVKLHATVPVLSLEIV